MNIDQYCHSNAININLDSDDELSLMDKILHLSNSKIEEMKGISSLQTELRYLLIRNIYDAAFQRRESLMTKSNQSLQSLSHLPSWSEVILALEENVNDHATDTNEFNNQDWKITNIDDDFHFMNDMCDQENPPFIEYVSMSDIEDKQPGSSKGRFLSFFYKKKWHQK